MSHSGCDDDLLLNYIQGNFEDLEYELNGDKYEKPRKHKYNFYLDCNKEKLIDYPKSILVCMNCGLCEYYPLYVRSYNHMMQPLRRKCI